MAKLVAKLLWETKVQKPVVRKHSGRLSSKESPDSPTRPLTWDQRGQLLAKRLTSCKAFGTNVWTHCVLLSRGISAAPGCCPQLGSFARASLAWRKGPRGWSRHSLTNLSVHKIGVIIVRPEKQESKRWLHSQARGRCRRPRFSCVSSRRRSPRAPSSSEEC